MRVDKEFVNKLLTGIDEGAKAQWTYWVTHELLEPEEINLVKKELDTVIDNVDSPQRPMAMVLKYDMLVNSLVTEEKDTLKNDNA